MASQYVRDLEGLAFRLRADGMVHAALIVERSATRMDGLEKVIVCMEEDRKSAEESPDN